MNEWNRLERDNLPPDILKSRAFEFEMLAVTGEFFPMNQSYQGIIHLLCEGRVIRFRRPEPKAPTHEEIMTKWWYVGSWERVDRFHTWKGKCQYRLTDSGIQPPDFFIDRESADIPPVA